MSQYISLVAFGTFGNPNGFKQTFYELSDKDFARNVKTFDLKTDAIKLFPKSEIYAIRKEYVNGNNSIAYSIYTFAKEQNSDRGGTFIGSSLLFTNKIADEGITVKCLNEFHSNLIENNLHNDIITANHSDKLIVGKPKDFKTLEYHLKEVLDLNFIQSSNHALVVYSVVNASELEQLFQKSIDLLNVYDTIYFTSSKEVAEFVLKRDIFKLVKIEGFEQEILSLQGQKKQKLELSISEFGKEKIKLEEDRKILIEEYKKQIEINEKLHQENTRRIAESKNDLNTINQKYENYTKKIDNAIRQLRNGIKPEVVTQNYKENKKIFIESIDQQKKPKFNNISNPSPKTSLKSDYQHKNHEQDHHDHRNRSDEIQRYDKFKILSFILLLLLAGTLILYINKRTSIIKTPSQENTNSANEQLSMEVPKTSVAETTNKKELNPFPNSMLNENDSRNVSRKIRQKMDLQDVVQIIFDANPTEVKNIYSDQIEIYSKYLLNLNKNCFEETNNKFLLIKDTLINIPSYKTNN